MVPQKLTFSPLSRRQIETDFSGGHITSDAGLLLLREVDKQHRLAQITASQRGKNSPKIVNQKDGQSDKPYHARAMSWAQRLKRVFNIDITECEKCENHNVSIIACIIDIHVIQKILAHIDKKHPTSKQTKLLPHLRAPPDEQYTNDFTSQRDFNFGA